MFLRATYHAHHPVSLNRYLPELNQKLTNVFKIKTLFVKIKIKLSTIFEIYMALHTLYIYICTVNVMYITPPKHT